uniref:COesterase domain-containing protein n=1 Tax=Macrostomum lignano TaxID=282301 RepID=A0A1I8I0S3_9PLAT
MDLRDAVQWVHANAAQFGGDPASITLMGHGYGAALVSLLMASKFAQVSPGETFLGVRNVILMGGTAHAPWATSPFFQFFSERLLNRLNLSSIATDQSLMSRMRHLSVGRILEAELAIPSLKYASRLGPVASESGFFSNNVAVELAAREAGLNGANLLVGFGRHSGQHLISELYLNSGMDSAEFDRVLRTLVHQTFRYRQQILLDVLANHYSDAGVPRRGGSAQASLARRCVDLLTDALFAAPSLRTAQLHARTSGSATYAYVFGYASSVPQHQRWAGGVWTDDLAFVLGAPLLSNEQHPLAPWSGSYLLEDRMLAEASMRYFGNFATS